MSRDETYITIADIHRLYRGVEADPELLQRVLRVLKQVKNKLRLRDLKPDISELMRLHRLNDPRS